MTAQDCPLVLAEPTGADVCSGESLIFSITVDDETLGVPNWVLPDGTTSSEYQVGYNFASVAGCNELQSLAYTLTCLDDNSLVVLGTVDVNVYVYNEVLVEIDDCAYMTIPDCPDDVVYEGGNADDGATYIAEEGESGEVNFVISNPGAPDECNVNSFWYAYDCSMSGIEDLLESEFQVNSTGAALNLNISLSEGENVEMSLMDLSGKKVEGLFEGFLEAGEQQRQFLPSTTRSGLYLFHISAPSGQLAKLIYL